MAQRHDWYITIISTRQRYRIEPGQSVIIGRTPLRPGSLPPEKAKRLSIPDPERSMSKRHLLLRLDDQGVAAVEDLASTNGTYVVRPDNRLIRLPAHQLLQLDESPVRLQLGDIGLELTRHNLPTAVQTVASTPVRQDGQTGTNDDAVSGTSHPASAADASAQTSASTPQTRPHGAVRTEPAVSDSSSADDSQVAGARAMGGPDAGAAAVIGDAAASTPAAASASARQEADAARQAGSTQDRAVDSSATPVVSPTSTSGSDLFSHHDEQEAPADLASGVDDIVAAREGEPTNIFDANKVRASVHRSQQAAKQTEETDETAAGVEAQERATAPVGSTGFEPGSVFDRLTRGEMGGQQAPRVEVDGLTSDEARHSADHDKQFQMARHRQLLPFLAANPYLYQELYDWLASIPDPVIAAALDHNPGYHGTSATDDALKR